MLNWLWRKIALSILLMLLASYSSASETIWKINVAKLGYRGDAARTILRWRGQYVVIGSVKFIPREESRQCVLAFDATQPLLVFDTTARKQVARETLISLEQDWEPPRAQKNIYPCSLKSRYWPSTQAINSEFVYSNDTEKNQFVIFDKDRKRKISHFA